MVIPGRDWVIRKDGEANVRDEVGVYSSDQAEACKPSGSSFDQDNVDAFEVLYSRRRSSENMALNR